MSPIDIDIDIDEQPLWTLEQGLALARQLEPIAVECGYHVALGGGVMLRGKSDKDLDLFFYPHSKPGGNQAQLFVKLQQLGFTTPKRITRTPEYPDEKEVRYSYQNDKRVDMFFVS